MTTDNQTISINDYTESAYLDYSMYVILDRALPNIADGLKPVQRRIVYAMNDLGLDHKAKHKKSARTVGDVLGKYHPHGDSACYEAMVMMAQDFSYRHPIVDGQGNWGSQDDPKSFAAMRYTEARMNEYAQVLLSELSSNTVDYKPNFDGTMKEPTVLPSRVPNILINGTTGIAVGMATDVPPHNLKEVIEATQYVIDNPEATTPDLLKIVKGPDFPTGGQIIIDEKELEKAYSTGRGVVKGRARYKIEKNAIVIVELPHQVSGSRILEQIGAQVEAKKLPMVDDLQDESDRKNPTRLVIYLKKSSKVDEDALMAHLFSTTDLERSYKINFNMIGLDGAPAVKPLNHILTEWIAFRRETVTRRLTNRADKIFNRIHIIEGLLVAHLNIDEVIRIIREEDEPKEALMKRFELTEMQANSILDIRLRNLAKLEEEQLSAELNELEEERAHIFEILNSEVRMNTLMKDELTEMSEKFADARRTEVITSSQVMQASTLSEDELIPAESVTIMLSQKGWIRSAKGHSIDDQQLSYKTGDGPNCLLRAKANEVSMLMDKTGRVFNIKNHILPSARGYGEQLIQHIQPQSGVGFVGMMSKTQASKFVLASSGGYGFICPVDELVTANKKGKAVLNTAGTNALIPYPLKDEGYLALLTDKHKMLIFKTEELQELPKGKGNKLLGLDAGDSLKQIIPLSEDATLICIQGDGKEVSYAPNKWMEYVKPRNRKGGKLPAYMKDVTLAVKKTDVDSINTEEGDSE